MLFQLPSFFAFLIAFVVLLSICPDKLRFPYLLAASLFFYSWWYPPYTLLLLGLVGLTWISCRLVERNRALLPLLVLVALSPLAVFKYTDFFLSSAQAVTGIVLPRLDWALPLGISFVTFTIVSLLVDTSRRTDTGSPGFMQIAVYITFFPHLIAGPILRAREMIPQLERIRPDWAALAPNLALFALGMLKKVLVADPIGSFVDHAYGSAGTVGGWEALLAVAGFAIQIYCDFSAYSDMAIALAGMFGVRFPENFRSPYLSWSMTELWRRWHMTLSFWLRDYVFIPLHSRLHKHAKHLSIVLTMAVSGIWHGANWTFVLWGILNGLVMAAEGVTGYARFAARQRGLLRAAGIAATFLVWSLAGIIFRAPNLTSAGDILAGAIGLRGWGAWPAQGTLTLALTVAIMALHPFDQVERIRSASGKIPSALIVPVALMAIMGCAMLAAGRPQNFYYFDF